MKTQVDIKLLNGSKQEVTYETVETVGMPLADGTGEQVFTAGEPLDDVPVVLDFSEGNQTVEAPEGYVVRSAVITKPEGAEQVIAKGETLAGIPGEYVTPGTTKEVADLDFSEGNHTVTAEGDERWNEVVVKKPEGLVPENIPKGIEIAGIPGEMESYTLQMIMERVISGPVEMDEVTVLPRCVFVDTQITNASFPACTSIQTGVFAGCKQLSTVTLGCDSNFYHHFGSFAFDGCTQLSEIKFMYSGSRVNGIIVPSGDNQGGLNAIFRNCAQLTAVHLSLKSSFGNAARTGTIGAEMFSCCYQLSQVTIDGFIGAQRLNGASSSYGMLEIGSCAFYACCNLSSLSISVVGSIGFYVGGSAFMGCSKLQDLWLNFASVPSSYSSKCFFLEADALRNTPMAESSYTGTYGTIHVTKNAYSYLRIASGWSAYAARMVSY